MPAPFVNNKGAILLLTLTLSFLIILMLSSYSTLLIQEAKVITFLKDSLQVKAALMSGLEIGLYQIINNNVLSLNQNYSLNGVTVNLNIKNSPIQTVFVTGEINNAKKQLQVIGEIVNIHDCVIICENLEFEKQLRVEGKGVTKKANKIHPSLLINNFRPQIPNIFKKDIISLHNDYFEYDDMLSLLADDQNISYTYTGNNLQIAFRDKQSGFPDVFVINNSNFQVNGRLTLKGSSKGTILIINQDFCPSYLLDFDKIMLIIKGKAVFNAPISGNGVLYSDENIFNSSVTFNGIIIAKNLKFTGQDIELRKQVITEGFRDIVVSRLFIFKDWRYKP